MSLSVFCVVNCRSSHWRCSMKKGVPKNSTKFRRKHLRQSLFFKKVAGLRSATLLKKKPWHRCFPAKFAKFLRAPFLQNTSGRLLLYLVHLCVLIKTAFLKFLFVYNSYSKSQVISVVFFCL